MTTDAYTKVLSILDAHLPDTGRSKHPDCSSPLAELELDSLSILEVIYELEEHFGFELSESQMKQLTTIDDLVCAFDRPARPLN